MIKVLVGVVVFLLTTVNLAAQGASAAHLFPQVPDGRQVDGSYYVSQFWITNTGPLPASCTLNLFGIGTDRLTTSPTFTIAAGAWTTSRTRGEDPIATGYSRLECTQPVTASAIYTLVAPSGQTAGMATVFSASAATFAVLPLLLRPGVRYGVAIANDNDLPAVVSLIFNHAGGQGGGKVLQIPSRAQKSVFVDEELSVPAQGVATLEIQANGTAGSGNFAVAGFLFEGAVFTTLIPASYR